MYKKAISMLIAVVLSMSLFACSATEQKDQPAQQNSSNEIYEIKNDIEIETPYAVLHYPIEWSSNLKIEQTQDDQKCEVKFVGVINNKEIDLFAIVFGESTEMPIGSVITANGETVTVRLNVDMFEPSEDLTPEEIETANEMIDAHYYTVEGLAEMDNFE